MPPQAVINSQQAFAASFAAWGATLHASSLTAAGLRPDDISASQELLASPAVTRLSVTLALYVWMHYLLHTHQADAAIMRGACGHVATLQVGRGKRRGRRPTAKGEHGHAQAGAPACISPDFCAQRGRLVQAMPGVAACPTHHLTSLPHAPAVQCTAFTGPGAPAPRSPATQHPCSTPLQAVASRSDVVSHIHVRILTQLGACCRHTRGMGPGVADAEADPGRCSSCCSCRRRQQSAVRGCGRGISLHGKLSRVHVQHSRRVG